LLLELPVPDFALCVRTLVTVVILLVGVYIIVHPKQSSSAKASAFNLIFLVADYWLGKRGP